MFRFGQRQRGSALLLALIVVVFAVIMGASLARSATIGKSMAAAERQLSQAYYVAESGLTDVLTRPDDYFTNDNFPVDVFFGTGPSWKSTTVFSLPGHDDLTFEIEVERVRPEVYEVRSMGHTAYASALAAAEIQVIPLASDMFGTVFAMGGLGVPVAVPGTPGEGEGNPAGVNYHFRGADVELYGVLTFEEDPSGEILQTARTFNIWGSDYRDWDGEQFLTWNHINHIPRLEIAPWLEPDKHGANNTMDFPVEVADLLYNQYFPSFPAADWTGPPEGSSAMRLKVGTDLDSPSPTPGKVEYLGDLSNNAYIDGLGHLKLHSANGFLIKELTLRGDLTIWVNSDIQIDRITPVEGTPNPKTSTTGTHKLVIISEGSIKIGGRASTYDPYPWFGQDLQPLYLHHGSVLWARHSLVIEGQVRAGLPSDYTQAERDDGPIFEYGDDESDEPFESPQPRGSIVLVSRGEDDVEGAHSLTAHTIDGRGIVYAGDRIKTFRIRLTGAVFVRNPYQLRRVRNEDVVGLAELYLTAGDPEILSEVGGQKLYIQRIRRTK